MKSTVNQKSQSDSNKPFPKIMISNDHIVLFTTETCGTVLKTLSGGYYSIGQTRTDWCINNFDDFKGSVTLSND